MSDRLHTHAERVENKESGFYCTCLQYTTYASSTGVCVFGLGYANTKQFDAFGTSSCAKAEQSNEHLQLFIKQFSKAKEGGERAHNLSRVVCSAA